MSLRWRHVLVLAGLALAATGAALAAGAGLSSPAAALASPGVSTARTSPAWTVSPSLTRISLRVPDSVAGTSSMTLSVSRSRRF